MKDQSDATQVKVAKITAFQAIIVAVVTAMGGGIGYFAGTKDTGPPPESIQRWLVIHGVDGPPGQSIRIVVSVNSVVYAYPADVPYTKIGMNMPEQKLPLPSGADEYTVAFEGQIRDSGTDAVEPAKSRSRPSFSVHALPRDKQQYNLHAVIGDEKQAEVALTVLYSFQ